MDESNQIVVAKEAPDQPPKATTIVTINGKVIDIAPALPFRMPTWQALRKVGVDPLRLARLAGKNELDLEPLEKIALAAIRLVEPTMPMDEIMNGLGFSDVATLAMAVLQAESSLVDRPTSTGSLSSPNGGAGDPGTSPT